MEVRKAQSTRVDWRRGNTSPEAVCKLSPDSFGIVFLQLLLPQDFLPDAPARLRIWALSNHGFDLTPTRAVFAGRMRFLRRAALLSMAGASARLLRGVVVAITPAVQTAALEG